MHEVIFEVAPGGALRGQARVPGDKSMSHRAVMLGSLAEGTSRISGFLDGEDCLATAHAFRAMGVDIQGPDEGNLVIHGVGLHGLQAPDASLDMGNAGTGMRLLAGVLAGQRFAATMIGDSSLSRRPMGRIADPLRQMGATVETTAAGTAPMTLRGGQLRGIDYALPVASAQIKSCLLLAGLYAEGRTAAREPGPSRDHTERMLETFGYTVGREGEWVFLDGGGRLRASDFAVPGDISSAAFLLVGASIAADSDLYLQGVGLNPTRTGVMDILRLMGADLELVRERLVGAEPVADIRVRSADLQGIVIPESLVPLAIDEFPALFIAAACARGETRLTGASELRVKESDRIQVMADGLQALGVDAQPTPDGMVIQGGSLRGGEVDSHGDHRIAMAFAMAGLRSQAPIRIRDCNNVATSFPGFAHLVESLGLGITTTAEANPEKPS